MGYCQNPLIPEMKLPSTSEESGRSFGSLAEKTVDDVLRRFCDTVDESRIHYRDFMIYDKEDF
ncbi:MAG: hypothetical protein WA151_12805, partial [Desulfatirhabdiaceae bacterium]